MRRKGLIAILGCAAALAVPAQAQDRQIDVELTSEMWALAGICSQYSGYEVRNEALAAWLNRQLASAGNADEVMDRRAAKVEQIRANMAALERGRGGSAREERLDRNTAGLMTRCRQLTNNPLAGQFFFTATG